MATDDQSDSTRSGSRWEPTPGPGDDAADEPTTRIPADDGSDRSDEAGQTSELPPAAEPYAAEPLNQPAEQTAGQPAPAARPSWRERRFLGVPVAAAVATGLVVASGLGGFALGAATTSDDLTPVGVRTRDGNGVPGLPGFPDDRDFDGDDDGQWHRFPGGPGQDQFPPDFDDDQLPPDFDGDQTPPDLDGDDGTPDDGSDGSDEDTGALT